jgi:isoleucyl-tRNA synthetase
MGPKYGKLVGEIFEKLNSVNSREVISAFDAEKTFTLRISDKTYELEKSDVIIETEKSGDMVSATDGAFAAILDTQLTPDLLREGFARELISKIQNLRKSSGFSVTDHINIEYAADADSARNIEEFAEEIARQTLCETLVSAPELTGVFEEITVNDALVRIKISKV